jgi:predicted nucleic acid-binding protein
LETAEANEESKASVYVETTIISYLVARPSRDLVMAGHQQITHEWWDTRRKDFDLYVSLAVVDEVSLGETEMAEKRLQAIRSFPRLDVHPEADDLAELFVKRGALPPKAAVDALHIAVAAVHKMDYLLTWNCKHIANVEIYRKVAAICREKGYEPPLICTPEELQGE